MSPAREDAARGGADPSEARLGLVLLHGRGGTATDILRLADVIGLDGSATIAPEAPGNSWWPDSFLAPMDRLEPYLSRAMDAVRAAVDTLVNEGLARDRIAVVGFSQGGCLALEFAARDTGPLFLAAGLSSGLIGTGDSKGPPESALYGFGPKEMDYPDRSDGLQVYISCHEQDPHIPIQRARQSAEVLSERKAEVHCRIHAGAGHGITEGDILQLRALLGPLTRQDHA